MRGAILALAALALACGRAPKPPAPAEIPPPAGKVPASEEAPAEGAPEGVVVTLYFPSADATALVPVTRSIVPTPNPGDRAKQIVNALIAGPGDAAEPALPEGTSLRQIYVDRTGTAWVDFSPEMKANLPGGSAAETLAVYAVVDSIGLNVPEIHSVGILVNGNPVETLNGHLDLRRPLPPRREWLRTE